MSKIKNIDALEILDSRGFPTVEAVVTLESGALGKASVPSGASTGANEALELRDKDSRYMGKGVKQAINNIKEIIAPKLKNVDSTNQSALDNSLIELDGTDNKSKLGANAMLAVSLANARAQATASNQVLFQYLNPELNISLPVPFMNILNGGAHADNNVDIQEFMIVPHGAIKFSESLRFGVEVYHSLKSILKQQSLSTAVGDEGGFAPDLSNNAQAIELILQAIEQTGLKAGQDISIALDCAASEFYKDRKYVLKSEGAKKTSEEFIDYLVKLVEDYPLISIEDGLAEQDWDAWVLLTEKLGNKIQLVGDDLFVTNPKFLQKGVELKAANAILIKLNQIGTLTETLDAINIAKKHNFNTIISHRSGETEDTFIADLSVATNALQIKTGAPCRGERVIKYNRLLYIEHALNTVAFAGNSILTNLKYNV